MAKNYLWMYDDEDSRNYEEFDGESEYDEEDHIEAVKGVTIGPCVYCHKKNSMKYDGHICFICNKCKMSIHEDLYYLWLAGFDIGV